MSSFARNRNSNDIEDQKVKLERKLYFARESPDTNFDLSECALKNVPSGIYSLCKVFRKEHLNLQHNFLHSLDDGGKMTDLEFMKKLNISHNKFYKIPLDICLLSNLRELYINNNKVKYFPNEIGNMVSLKILDASNNCLSELSSSLGRLVNLRVLLLQGNKDLRTLCVELCHLKYLRQLGLDGDNFDFPPSEICAIGTFEIMKYLCESCDMPYTQPLQDDESTSNNSPPLLSPLEKNAAAKNSYTTWEKEEENLHRLENEMHQAAMKQKEKFLMEFTKEQMKIDCELTKFQVERDNDRLRLIKQIQEEEFATENLVSKLLELHNQNPLHIQQFLEHDQKEHDKLLEMCRTNYSNMKTVETLKAMQSLLEEECQYEKSLKQYGESQSEVKQSFLLTELISTQQTIEILKTRDEMQSVLVEQLLQDEAVQKAAVGALLEKCDSRTWGLVQEIAIVENHLAKLSSIEMERRKLELCDNIENLADQRIKLSLLLVNLLAQQETRRSQLIDTLQAMELERTTSPYFWLMRYQQLLDSVPEVVVSSQKQLDPIFAAYLLQEGVIHCLPFLIQWVSSKHELSTMTDDLLLKQGVILSSDRNGILKAARLYLEDIEAERLKLGKGDGEDVLPSAPSMGEMFNIDQIPDGDEVMTNTKENDSECVVCMENVCAVIFIPCGHFCCCSKCSDSIDKLCPMCRGDIERKIRVIMP